MKRSEPEDDDGDDGLATSREEKEFKDFLVVKKNKAAVLANLVSISQKIEALWLDLDQRLRLLKVMRACLVDLADHKDDDVRELARLGPKMKNLDLELNHYLNLFLPIERKHSRGLRDDQFLVTDSDRPAKPAQKIPLVVILDNMRSAFNVGAVFRTSDCIGVEELFLCGYTATPDVENTAKTTMGAHEHVKWSHVAKIETLIDELKAQGVLIVALETAERSEMIYKFSFPKRKVALILGNERFGIEPRLLEKCDHIVAIPTNGVKNSLNVGVAFGVCGYEILRQWSSQ